MKLKSRLTILGGALLGACAIVTPLAVTSCENKDKAITFRNLHFTSLDDFISWSNKNSHYPNRKICSSKDSYLDNLFFSHDKYIVLEFAFGYISLYLTSPDMQIYITDLVVTSNKIECANFNVIVSVDDTTTETVYDGPMSVLFECPNIIIDSIILPMIVNIDDFSSIEVQQPTSEIMGISLVAEDPYRSFIFKFISSHFPYWTFDNVIFDQ